MKTQTQQTLPAYQGDVPTPGSLFVTIGGALVLLLLLAVVVTKGARFFGFGAVTVKGNRLLKIRSSLSVGQRERVVVIEIEERWLVLGISPAGITALSEMARNDSAGEETSATLAGEFQRMLQKRLSARKPEAAQ